MFFIHETGRLERYLECSEFMTEPSDIAVYNDDFYICDFKVRNFNLYVNGSMCLHNYLFLRAIPWW